MPTSIPIVLNIAYVGEKGNTEKGEYFYSCVPSIINVTEPDTQIEISLSKESRIRFELQSVFSTDAFDQITVPIEVNGNDLISINHKNKKG